MATPDEKREAAERLIQVADLEDEAEEAKTEIETSLDIKLTGFLQDLGVVDESEAIIKLSQEFSVNASVAKKYLDNFPDKYLVKEQYVPDIIKDMRKERRSLKGDYREKMSKAIDTLIDGYSEHLEKCIDSIYWIAPYKSALQQMRYTEGDLLKIHSIKDIESRRNIVDSLCKFWEAQLEQSEISYGDKYSSLQKEMNNAKREFRKYLSENGSIKKSIRDETNEFILKAVSQSRSVNI